MEWGIAFHIITTVSFVSWAILIIAPRTWKLQLIPQAIMPFLLCLAYTGLLLVSFPKFQGVLAGLEHFKAAGQINNIVLMGWLHIQAFNLMLGSWMAYEAEEAGISRLTMVPILMVSIVFAPVGFVIFRLIRSRYEATIIV